MISGVSHGNGFKGAVAYVTEKDDARVLDLRGVFSERTAATEMRAVAAQSERVQKPVYHRWFRVAEGENLTDAQWLSVVDKAEQALGLDGHQRVVVRHGDDHVHVVWNRVNPETYKAQKVSHDFAKCEQVCRQAEIDYGLQAVPGHHSWKQAGAEQAPAARQATSGEQWNEDRTGREPFARIVADVAADAFKTARSWDDLADRLQRGGLTLQPYRQGLVVTDGTERAAVSAVTGNEWTRGKLEKRFGQTWADYQAGQDRPGRAGLDRPGQAGQRDPQPTASVRSRADSEAKEHAAWMREQYERFRAEWLRQARQSRQAEVTSQSAAAWSLERSIRAKEAEARRQEAQRRKALARAVAGRFGGSMLYGMIDSRYERRRREDYAKAAARWQQTKAQIQAIPRHQAPDFRTWLKSQATLGNVVASRHLQRMDGLAIAPTPAQQARPVPFQQPAQAVRPPASPARPMDPAPAAERPTDGAIEAEWKALVAERTADLRQQAQKRLAVVEKEWSAADRYSDEVKRQQPREPEGMARFVPGATARYEAARQSWHEAAAAAEKARRDALHEVNQLKEFLAEGHVSKDAETVHMRARKDVAAQRPDLAQRMEQIHERQKTEQMQAIEQRRQEALERFQQKRDQERGQGSKGWSR